VALLEPSLWAQSYQKFQMDSLSKSMGCYVAHTRTSQSLEISMMIRSRYNSNSDGFEAQEQETVLDRFRQLLLRHGTGDDLLISGMTTLHQFFAVTTYKSGV
jgi:hypothetical protein